MLHQETLHDAIPWLLQYSAYSHLLQMDKYHYYVTFIALELTGSHMALLGTVFESVSTLYYYPTMLLGITCCAFK